MSCDPHYQSPVSPNPAISSVGGQAPLTRSPTTISNLLRSTQDETTPSLSNNKYRARPRSWLSISRGSFQGHTARSQSLHLPKDITKPPVDTNTISAPVLTSTTNTRVANAEGVQNTTLVSEQSVHLAAKRPVLGSIESHLTRLTGAVRTIKIRNGFAVDDHSSESTSESKPDGRRASVIEHGVARRRAETINLCRDKINKLTGHGFVRRKMLGDIASNPPLSEEQTRFVGIPDASANFGPGSLTKSFASAVDKLDFQPSSTKKFVLRSRSSIFNLRKHNEEKPFHRTANDPDEQPSLGSSKSALRELHGEARALCSTREFTFRRNEDDLASDTKNGSSSLKTAYSSSQSIDPLRMHIEVNSFTTAPLHLKIPKRKETDSFNTTDDEETVIDDAPIYSPSSGDLKQYAQTPPSANRSTESCVELETPTRMPGQTFHMKRLGLRKSKSGLMVFSRRKATDDRNIPGRSSAIKKSRSLQFDLFKRGQETTVSATEHTLGFTPTTPSPLRAMTINSNTQCSERDHRRVPPRLISPTEQAKRQGVIGLPKDFQQNTSN